MSTETVAWKWAEGWVFFPEKPLAMECDALVIRSGYESAEARAQALETRIEEYKNAAIGLIEERELLRERAQRWEEDAQRYCQNSDHWRERAQKAEQALADLTRDLDAWMRRLLAPSGIGDDEPEAINLDYSRAAARAIGKERA